MSRKPSSNQSPPGWQRTLFLAASAGFAASIIVVAHGIMLPFVLALVVAYVLTPAVLRLERARVPRWAAILIVYFAALGTIGGFVALTVPRLVAEGKALTTEGPRLVARAKEWLPVIDARLTRWFGSDLVTPARSLNDTEPPPEDVPPPSIAKEPPPVPDDERPSVHVARRPDGSFDVIVAEDVQLREVREGVWQLEQARPRRGLSSATMLEEALTKGVGYIKANSLTVLKVGQEIAAAISRGIFNLFMTLMLAGYMILTHERILKFFRELWPPESRPSFDRFLRRLDRGLSGVVRGQLLICFVNGVLSAIGFWLFDLKYWPILALVAAVMSLIPIFGSILSSIPAVAIGLTQSPATALGVLAWIVGIHQLEANFLNPKIIGDAAKIHPVMVVFSLLAGEHFFQIAGALFAVPCMSVIQTIFLHFRESTLGVADPSASIPPARLTPLPAQGPLVPPPAALGVEPVHAAATPVPTSTPRPKPEPAAGEVRGSDPGGAEA